MRLRDVANAVGITERAAQRIIADLADAGYLERRRDGRRNRYELHGELPLRHPLEKDHPIGELLAALQQSIAAASPTNLPGKPVATRRSLGAGAQPRRI